MVIGLRRARHISHNQLPIAFPCPFHDCVEEIIRDRVEQMSEQSPFTDFTPSRIFYREDDWIRLGDSITISVAEMEFDSSFTFADTKELAGHTRRVFDEGAFFEILRRHANLPYLLLFRPKRLSPRKPERVILMRTLGYERPCGHLPAYWQYCSEPAEVSQVILHTIADVLQPSEKWLDPKTLDVVEVEANVPYRYL